MMTRSFYNSIISVNNPQCAAWFLHFLAKIYLISSPLTSSESSFIIELNKDKGAAYEKEEFIRKRNNRVFHNAHTPLCDNPLP